MNHDASFRSFRLDSCNVGILYCNKYVSKRLHIIKCLYHHTQTVSLNDCNENENTMFQISTNEEVVVVVVTGTPNPIDPKISNTLLNFIT